KPLYVFSSWLHARGLRQLPQTESLSSCLPAKKHFLPVPPPFPCLLGLAPFRHVLQWIRLLNGLFGLLSIHRAFVQPHDNHFCWPVLPPSLRRKRCTFGIS